MSEYERGDKREFGCLGSKKKKKKTGKKGKNVEGLSEGWMDGVCICGEMGRLCKKLGKRRGKRGRTREDINVQIKSRLLNVASPVKKKCI